MAELVPLFACERMAAKLLDMKPAEFSDLVNSGHLPKPRVIGGLERWDVPELQRIISGEAVDGMGDVRW